MVDACLRAGSSYANADELRGLRPASADHAYDDLNDEQGKQQAERARPSALGRGVAACTIGEAFFYPVNAPVGTREGDAASARRQHGEFLRVYDDAAAATLLEFDVQRARDGLEPFRFAAASTVRHTRRSK